MSALEAVTDHGTEHENAAEHLIERVEHLKAGSKEAVECLARAQVHATLALLRKWEDGT
jgi:hypothetical protein